MSVPPHSSSCSRKGHLGICREKSTKPKVEEIKRIQEQQYLRNGGVGHRYKSSYRCSESDGGNRFKATIELYRHLCCTRQRMQLVVMAAVLALAAAAAAAGAGQGCSFGCHPTSISIPVESCGRTEFVNTSVCVGQCYHEDPVYIGYDDWPKQKICNGDWSYEVKHIKGCPVGVSYPVAKNCECTACNSGNTYCGRFPGDIPSCLPF